MMDCEVSSYDNSSRNHVSSAAPWTFLIASGGNVSSERYSLITDPKSGQYDLQIKQTIQNDSGTYVCTEANCTTGTTKKHSAQLILLSRFYEHDHHHHHDRYGHHQPY